MRLAFAVLSELLDRIDKIFRMNKKIPVNPENLVNPVYVLLDNTCMPEYYIGARYS